MRDFAAALAPLADLTARQAALITLGFTVAACMVLAAFLSGVLWARR